MSEKKNELTPQELAVKRYLDEQSAKDNCLRSFYLPSKIKDCFNYITEQARKEAVSGCAMVEDSVVYKWARDYYIEVLPKEAEKEAVEIVQKKAEIITEKKEVTVVRTKDREPSLPLLFDFEE